MNLAPLQVRKTLGFSHTQRLVLHRIVDLLRYVNLLIMLFLSVFGALLLDILVIGALIVIFIIIILCPFSLVHDLDGGL
jgi:hypothetical protein